jgi:hypothetical protein
MDEWVALKNCVRCMQGYFDIVLCFIFDEESFSKMFLSVSARVIRLRLTLGPSSAFYY